MVQEVIPSLNIGVGEFGKSLIPTYFKQIQKFDQNFSKLTVNSIITTGIEYFSILDELSNQLYQFRKEDIKDDELTLSQEVQAEFSLAILDLYSKTLSLRNAIVPSGFSIGSNKILIHILVPLFEKTSLPILNIILDAVEHHYSTGAFSGFELRIIAFSSSIIQLNNDWNGGLKRRIEYEKATAQNLKLLTANGISRDVIINNVFLFDGINRNGLSLEMNTEGIAIALNEVVLANMLNPYFFSAVSKSGTINSLGVGIIQLNQDLLEKYFEQRVMHSVFVHEGLIGKKAVPIDDIIQKTNQLVRTQQNYISQKTHEILVELKGDSRSFKDFYEKKKDRLKEDYQKFEAISKKFHEEVTEKAISKSSSFAFKQSDELKQKLLDGLTVSNKSLFYYKTFLENAVNEQIDSVQGFRHIRERLTLDDIEFEAAHYFIQFLPKEKQIDRKELNDLWKKFENYAAEIRKLDDEYEDLKKIDDSKKIRKEISFEKGIFKVDSKIYHAEGVLPSPKFDPSRYYKRKNGETKQNIVDLRAYFPPIEDQGPYPTCCSFATCSAFEYFTRINNQEQKTSKYYLYHHAKLGNYNTEGLSIYDALKTFQAGVCKDELWPYEPTNYKVVPPEDLEEDAAKQQVFNFAPIGLNEEDFFSALSEGFPIVIELRLYKSFHTAEKGVIPVPHDSEILSGTHGNHAMVVVGYSIAEKHFIVRNSWGDSWGDSGYCYIPFHYILNSKHCHTAMIVSEIVCEHQVEYTSNNENTLLFNEEITLAQLNHISYNKFKKQKEKCKTQKEYKDKLKIYQESLNELCDPSKRDKILARELEKLQNKSKELLKNIKVNDEKFLSKKQKSKKKKTIVGISSFLILILSIIISFIFSYLFAPILIFPVVGFLWFMKLRQQNKNIKLEGNQIKAKKRFSSFANYLSPIEDEILNLRVRFTHNGELLDQIFVIKNHLTKRYAFTRYYINELQKWYLSDFSDIKNSDFEHPVFVKELANKRTIDNYYNEVESNLIKKWPNILELLLGQLKELNEDSDRDDFEKSVSLVKTDILQSIRGMVRKIEKFDIQEYLMGNGNYPWLPDVTTEIGDFVSVAEKMCCPFIHIKAACIKEPQISSCILRRNGKHAPAFDNQVNNHDAVKNWQMLNNDSLHKISFITVDYNISPADTVATGVGYSDTFRKTRN